MKLLTEARNYLLTALFSAMGGVFVFSQYVQFEQVLPLPPTPHQMTSFEQLDGDNAIGDVDGDNDLDVLVQGSDGSTNKTLLYLNDGSGNYSLSTSVFIGVRNGSVALFDADMDNDLDALIVGNLGNVNTTNLYLNDGNGNFSADINNQFTGFAGGSANAIDLENDGDQDLILTGFTGQNTGSAATKLYLNDGFGNFSELSGLPFEQVCRSSVSVADLNHDFYDDILLVGVNSNSVPVSKLYYNTGGTFTESSSVLTGMNWGFCDVADIDGDLDKDLIICGSTSVTTIVRSTIIYKNDGNGNFSVWNTPTVANACERSSCRFVDLDLDNDQDLFIQGHTNLVNANALLYLNDGTGNFTQIFTSTIDRVYGGAARFGDITGDGFPDLLLSGQITNGRVTNLYVNDGSGILNLANGSTLTGVYSSDTEFLDIDQDNDQDLILTGATKYGLATILYVNDGLGNYSPKDDSTFIAVQEGEIACADVNGDSFDDILITGTNGTKMTKLYLNDGLGNFTLQPNTPFVGIKNCAAAFSDIEHDGDMDLMISGYTGVSGSIRITKLYTNDGAGNFIENSSTFIQAQGGSICFVDVNHDTFEDVVISGYASSSFATLYMNDGAGNFIFRPNGFSGVVWSSIDAADVNGDGHPDLLMSGEHILPDWSGVPATYLYLNDGDGNFVQDSINTFKGVSHCSIQFADVNGDSAPDILLTGHPETAFYMNDGTGLFSEVYNTPFVDLKYSSIDFADIDGDLDLDVVTTGKSPTDGIISRLYKNNPCTPTSLALASPALPDFITACEVSTITAPVAITNCGSGILGTTNDLPLSNQGIHSITWNFDDAHGNLLTQTQTIIIHDTIGPLPDISSLPDVTAQCSVDNLQAPTAMDNCSGIINATSSLVFPIATQDTTIVTWVFTDSNGNSSTQTQRVIIHDTTPPTADLAILPDVNAQCFVANLPIPTATDYCSGIINGTNSLIFPITAQDTTIVTWTFTDTNGNSSTQTQRVIIHDSISPTADLASLPDVHAQCSVANLPIPTATDNCSGTINGINNTVFPITVEDTTIVTWVFTDTNGNSYAQLQRVIIHDDTPPVADLSNLPDVNAQCSVANLPIPTATDNCSGNVNGTNNMVFPITAQDTTIVTWVFTDTNGNSSTQTQRVVIHDDIPPATDLGYLPDVNAQCSVANLPIPTATDNCSGIVSGTNSLVFPITAQDTTIVTWIFIDANGNSTSQTQLVIIHDDTPPTADLAILPDILETCSITNVPVPTASDDCSGSILGVTNTLFPIETHGTTVIDWEFTDGGGNSIHQSQQVTITGLNTDITVINTNELISNESNATYQWLDCSNSFAVLVGQTDSIFVPLNGGIFALEISKDGCVDTSQCVQVAINDLEDNSMDKIKFIPNPTAGNVTIYSGSSEIERVRLYADNGTLVYEKRGINQQVLEMEFQVEPGVYYLEVSTNDSRIKKKLIKI